MEEHKVGIWKGPYHGSRACIELIKRINKVTMPDVQFEIPAKRKKS